MRRRDFLRLVPAAGVAVACDKVVLPTPPDPVPPPTTTTSVPDRIDTEPVLSSVVGTTAFSLALRDEAYINAFVRRVQDHGYNTIRVGAETSDWGGGYMPQGPDISTPQAMENLQRLLDTTARTRIWVQLIPVFTVKGRDDFPGLLSWTRQVADTSLPYRHVFFEAVNEYYVHSRLSERQVIELLRVLRDTGKPTGTDANMAPGAFIYPSRLRGHVDYISFHSFRNPPPAEKEYKRVVERNGGLVLFSETTAYATDWEIQAYELQGRGTVSLYGRGSEEERKNQITEEMDTMRRVQGAQWFFHSIETMRCETLDFWMSQA